jgi:DNA-binding transcriptional LysR family regulator
MGNIDPLMKQYSESTAGIEANDLLIFARVADLGSFSRAAERLGLPKSTVSRRIAWLESHLGERLLLRTTRRQSLTEFGALLLEHARQVVAEVDAVTALREHRQAVPSGRLRVSMPSDFATLLLADMLAAFVAQHPRITLELDLSPRRVDLLGEGYDIAVRMGAFARRCLAGRTSVDRVHQWFCTPHQATWPNGVRRPARKICCSTTRYACRGVPATAQSPAIGYWYRANSAGKAHRPPA